LAISPYKPFEVFNEPAVRVEGNEVLGNKNIGEEYDLTPNPLKWDDGVPRDDGVERIVGASDGSNVYQAT
jgi:hypothetical protein